MDGGVWWVAVIGVAKSWTRLSDFTFPFHFRALEKEMATHSSCCLENPRDGGAWWATVCGVAQSRTRLKWLSSSSSSSDGVGVSFICLKKKQWCVFWKGLDCLQNMNFIDLFSEIPHVPLIAVISGGRCSEYCLGTLQILSIGISLKWGCFFLLFFHNC